MIQTLAIAAALLTPTPSLTEDTLYPRGRTFPLIMMAIEPADFPRAKALGFNTVHRYHSLETLEQARAYTQAAQDHGLMVMQNMAEAWMSKPKSWWIDWIREMAKLRNIAWWHLQEERPASQVRHIAAAAHEADPLKRPVDTYLNTQSETELRDYKGAVDIMVRSDYPTLYQRPRVSVLAWMKSFEQAESSIPYRMGCAELFGAGSKPTPHELRFDMYAALVGGAKGMAFYKWQEGALVRPDLLEAAARFAWEMYGRGHNPTPLGPVVLSARGAPRVVATVLRGPAQSPLAETWDMESRSLKLRDWPSIQVLESDYREWTYLIAVNCAQPFAGRATYGNGDVTVRFRRLPPRATEIEVLFEKRRLRATAGEFDDRFKSLGVHIYRWRRG